MTVLLCLLGLVMWFLALRRLGRWVYSIPVAPWYWPLPAPIYDHHGKVHIHASVLPTASPRLR